MTLERERSFLWKNLPFYLVGILVVLGLKYYYSQADCDSLLWILTPTTRWVELLSGISFTYISGTGYVNHSLRLLIAPSCSGVQFMIITIATLVFSFVHRVASPQAQAFGTDGRVVRGLGWIAASIVFAWLFTILVNGLRIIIAIYLPLYLDSAGLMGGMLTPDRLHTVIGVVVYFVALLTLYRLSGYFVHRMTDSVNTFYEEARLARSEQGTAGRQENSFPGQPKIKGALHTGKRELLSMLARRCLPPIFWYFFMTLGIPFLNRAYWKAPAEFTEFALLLICCVTLIFLPYAIVTLFKA